MLSDHIWLRPERRLPLPQTVDKKLQLEWLPAGAKSSPSPSGKIGIGFPMQSSLGKSAFGRLPASGSEEMLDRLPGKRELGAEAGLRQAGDRVDAATS
jgi:hypothetical protein